MLTNALDAMPKGEQLTVSTRSEHGDAVIEITDTGVGIAPKDINRLFEPFFTTKHDGKGADWDYLSATTSLQNSGGGKSKPRVNWGKVALLP
ncbi:ATP-binding protein [Chloroflexota bacterium]